MPYPFRLPTTSSIAFQDFISSNTHPSLPSSATTYRGVVRNVLKKHKRLPPTSQTPHLTDVLTALDAYVPHLLAIDAGISGRGIADEDIEIILAKEVKVEWRAVLAAGIPGREPARVNLQSLEYEVLFTLSTLASTHCLLARSHLHELYDAITPTVEQRGTAINTAMKHLLEANSIYNYAYARAVQLPSGTQSPLPDVSASALGALASLAMAEATLLAVLKDDPYPAAVVQDRNKQDKEWMFKAPEISSVRALLFARICLASADHASKAQGMLGRSSKIVESLPRYLEDLRRTARAKACRFFGIDAEMASKTGEGIAWLRGAKKELGFAALGAEEEKKSRGFSKLRKDWVEKREDKKIEKGGEWGADAGRFDEGRVVEMLMAKWDKMNSIVNRAAPALRTTC